MCKTVKCPKAKGENKDMKYVSEQLNATVYISKRVVVTTMQDL